MNIFKLIGHSKITLKVTFLAKPVQKQHSKHRLGLGIAKLGAQLTGIAVIHRAPTVSQEPCTVARCTQMPIIRGASKHRSFPRLLRRNSFLEVRALETQLLKYETGKSREA